MPRRFPRAPAWLGVESPSDAREKWLGAIGAFVGIASTILVNTLITGNTQPIITGAMGATAVLLFAVPHGALSQPWPVAGGHLVSAIVGVLCAKSITDPTIAASAAVALAVFAMAILRCLHPPGGATALIAVIGGSDIHSLGFAYILDPVMLDATLILMIAVAFNSAFAWRRYPAAWSYLDEPSPTALPVDIEHEDIQAALAEIGWVVDVTEADLKRLFGLTMAHAMIRTGKMPSGRP